MNTIGAHLEEKLNDNSNSYLAGQRDFAIGCGIMFGSDSFGGTRSLDEVLSAGVNNLDLNPDGTGATRLTTSQIDWFKANYEIVTHYPNDAAGFSATLFRNIATGEYTLGFRSTEYQLFDLGGDWERDGGTTGADNDIKNAGFALAQLASMETFYANLQQGKVYDAKTQSWEPRCHVPAG